LTPPDVRHEILPNGLHVLLREVRVAPVAEVQIWAQVGSADERPGEEGLAHFHEHMLFKGTRRRGVGEVAGEIEGAGGRINAYTSFDTTVYHATVPRAATATAVDVLADAVRHSTFEPAEVTREIEVVLEEIRRGEDSPGQVLGNAVFAEAFRVHPYRAPILGTRESVASFSQEKVSAFFRRWYTPENLLVVAVGDFDADDVLAAVRTAFEDAPRGDAARRRAAEPAREALHAHVLRRPFERASFELAYPAPGFASPDAPLLDLVAYILGEGDSARLVRRVKEEEGLADRVDASAYTPLDPGLFFASADVDPALALASIEAIAREIERVRVEPVQAEELERARANFLATEHFERESVSGIARKMGSFHVLAGDWRAEEAYFAAVRGATAADLLRAAREHLAPERMTAALLLPSRAPAELDAAAVRGAVERGVRHVARTFRPPASLPGVARAKGGESAIHGYALSNGGRLFVWPRREVPVVALRASFLGGLLAEDAESVGLSGFLSAMWLRGTRVRSAGDFARAVESLAAEIDGFSGRSSLGLTLEVPSPQLEPALELYAEALCEPGFDRTEITNERRDTLAALARREDRLADKAFDLFARALYPSHPYGLPLVGTKSSVRAITRASLEAHAVRLVRGANLALAVAGDVDPDAVAARLSALLAPLGDAARDRSDPFVPPSPAAEPPLDGIQLTELRKRRAQAHLVLGFRGLSVYDDDRFALEIVSQMLAGQGGRLFLELRDRRSLAYSVSAVNVEGVAPGFFALYIGTAPEKLDAARTGMLEELEKLVSSPPTDDELRRAQRYLTGNFAIDLQRSTARAAHMAQDALFGLGADAHLRYAERIEAVRKDDVLRVAQRVVDLRAYVLASVRP
jgi:zinc protease